MITRLNSKTGGESDGKVPKLLQKPILNYQSYLDSNSRTFLDIVFYFTLIEEWFLYVGVGQK